MQASIVAEVSSDPRATGYVVTAGRDSVFFFSTHQEGWYPGTGWADETGAGEGKRTTLNVPFPEGADGSKQGVDDYIVANGPEAFNKLVEAAPPR